MWKAIGSRVLLAILGVFMALGLAEAGLRLADVAPGRELKRFPFWWVEPHELFGWFHTPSTTFKYGTPLRDFRNPVTINSSGLREREYGYRKPSGVQRILIIGDSFTASLEVPLHQTWHELTEETLNTQGEGLLHRTEIIAAGVQAWGTGQHLLYYRHEGYRYEPDVVVLQFYQNDVFDNDPNVGKLTGTVGVGSKPYFTLEGERLELRDFPYRSRRLTDESVRPSSVTKQIRGELRKRSHLFRFARNRFLTMRAAGTPRRTSFCPRSDLFLAPLRPDEKIPYQLTVYESSYPQEFREAWELTIRLIRELKIEVAKRDQRLAVIHVPDRRQILPDVWQATLDCWPSAKAVKWDLDKPNRLLGGFLRSEGIAYLDLTPPLREHAKRTGQSPFLERDGHFNPEGHRLVSSIVHQWLIKERIVSTR